MLRAAGLRMWGAVGRGEGSKAMACWLMAKGETDQRCGGRCRRS